MIIILSNHIMRRDLLLCIATSCDIGCCIAFRNIVFYFSGYHVDNVSMSTIAKSIISFWIFFRKYEFYRGGYKWGNNSSDICISHPEWTNESFFEWYPAEQEFAFVPYFLGGSVSGEHVGPPPRPIPITMYGLGLREQIFLDHSRARICSYIIMCGMKLLIHSQNSTVPPLKFGNEWVISSHVLLCTW